MRLLHRLARQTRLNRLLAEHDRNEADLAAMSDPHAKRPSWCRDCGNRARSAACVKACGGAR